MKIIKTKRNVTLQFVADTNVVVNMELPPNNSFVMSDGVCSQTTALFGTNSIEIIKDLKELPNKYNNDDLTGKKLLLIREGGCGDILFCGPAIKYLKEKYPTCQIAFSCSPVYHPIFNNHPHVDQIYPHILGYEEFSKFDFFLTFEGLIEGSEEARTVNAYDLFIKNFGIPLEEITDKTPVMVVSDDVKEYWKFTLKDSINNEKRVGFQLRASSPIRTVPQELNAQIIQGLLDKGYTVFLIDSVTKRNEMNYFINKFGFADNERVIDTSKYSDNFERMAGIISLMSLYAGPDSSGTHIAAALGIPIVGIFGAFRSSVRLQYYKNAIGIDCIADKCGIGCFAHGYTPQCPVSQELNTQYPPCWSLLEVDKVVEAIEGLYHDVYKVDTVQKQTLPVGDRGQIFCPVCGYISKFMSEKEKHKFYSCMSCGTLFTPELDRTVVETDNDGGDIRNDELRFSAYLNRMWQSKPILEKIVDFGCDKGGFVSYLKNKNIDASGIDVNTKLQIADIDDNSIDAISMVEVIEHLLNPDYVFGEFERILKHQGVIYIESSFYSGQDISSWEYCSPKIGHCCIYTEKSLQYLAERFGFTVNKINNNVFVFKKS